MSGSDPLSRSSTLDRDHRFSASVAFVWGFAEATLFFVVPDVYITRVALRDSLRRALLACVWALAGALLGGLSLWFAASQLDDASRLLRTFVRLPGINRELAAATGLALREHGPIALLSGGLIGQPYKLFAVHAGAQQVPLVSFLLFSAAARLTRFALTATLAWFAGQGLKQWPLNRRLYLHALVWVSFYAIYFIAVR